MSKCGNKNTVDKYPSKAGRLLLFSRSNAKRIRFNTGLHSNA